MKLKDMKSKKLLNEIVLAALTYRTSFKSIAEYFCTDEDEVRKTLYENYIAEIRDALQHLDVETSMEDDSTTLSTYNFKKYFIAKEKMLKLSKCETDEEKINDIELKLDELKKNIDDREVDSYVPINSRYYTPEMKDKIVRYQLKYYLSDRKMQEIFHFDKNTLKKYEEEYLIKKPIYAEKYERLHDFYSNISSEKYNGKPSAK